MRRRILYTTYNGGQEDPGMGIRWVICNRTNGRKR